MQARTQSMVWPEECMSAQMWCRQPSAPSGLWCSIGGSPCPLSLRWHRVNERKIWHVWSLLLDELLLLPLALGFGLG